MAKMNNKLRQLVQRAETWPEAAQEAAVASLQAIEEDYLGLAELTREDLEALKKSGEDVRVGRFANEAEIHEVFGRRS